MLVTKTNLTKCLLLISANFTTTYKNFKIDPGRSLEKKLNFCNRNPLFQLEKTDNGNQATVRLQTAMYEILKSNAEILFKEVGLNVRTEAVITTLDKNENDIEAQFKYHVGFGDGSSCGI